MRPLESSSADVPARLLCTAVPAGRAARNSCGCDVERSTLIEDAGAVVGGRSVPTSVLTQPDWLDLALP